MEIIDQEARRLAHLVENVLHFSRAERQSLRLCPVPTLLAPQVREIAEKKMVDLNANDVEAAARMIAGSARSMGLQVVEE